MNGTSARLFGRALFSLVLLLPALTPIAAAQHNVPGNEQDGDNDCGPAAAASCLKWFQQNGYPDLKAGNGGNGLKDFENQLETDAETGENGTWAHKLMKAMNKLVNGTAYKGQLQAKLPDKKSDYGSFDYLDSEFSHNEDILLLLSYKDEDGNQINHYVTVKNITGAGDTRSCEYMDPATGGFKTGEMKFVDGKMQMKHDDKDVNIAGILTMSPANTTESKAEPVDPNNPAAGTKITYTVYYPPHRPTKDLHVWVSDCTKTNYQVSGLPAGWQWDVKQEGNRCYIHFWKDGSNSDIPNGGSITVTYTGPGKVKEAVKVITPTTDGNGTVSDGALPPGNGHTVAAVSPENPPGAPARVAMGLIDVTPESVSALVAWEPVSDPNVALYEVYDMNTGDRVAETPGPQWQLFGLEPDVIHEYAVVARSFDVLGSETSASVLVYHDQAGALDLLPGPQQQLAYVSPLYSGDAPTMMRLTLPGSAAPGKLHVITMGGAPLTPLPAGHGSQHEHYYQFFSDVPLNPGPVHVAVPYHSTDVEGSESGIRLLALLGGQWVDVTTGVDPSANLVMGQLPQLAPLVIVNGPASVIPASSTLGLIVLALVVCGAGVVVMTRRGGAAVA
ncbi:MAG: hypothetical protein LC135_00695 [Phycisphaerae bacterium]|nr:hypothetical protein [Phycisphaerae bacterium]MCZ2398370.1 hypothetical protein [Phycisphaerae bacterium]